jgi:hypothetical protein
MDSGGALSIKAPPKPIFSQLKKFISTAVEMARPGRAGPAQAVLGVHYTESKQFMPTLNA